MLKFGRLLVLTTPVLSVACDAHAPTRAAAPLIPTLLTTPESIPEGKPILFEWLKAKGAKSYDLEIASDSGFGTVVDSANVALRSYTHAGLTPGDYWWRVRAVNSAEAGAWATALSIRVEVFPQAFTLVGNQIEDESGDPIIFRGMSSMDPVMQKHTDWPEGDGVWSEDEYATMSGWGAQIVRLPVHPIAWQDHGETEVLSVLDQTIAWVAAHRMYAIIDFHSIGFPPTETYEDPYDEPIYLTSQAEILDFWDAMSMHYAGDERVAFYDIYNEPANLATQTGNADDWDDWKTFVESVIALIRANDPDKPILVNGLQWGYDLSYVAANPVSTDVVYGTHPYPWTDWNIGWDESFGALSDTHPVMVTEFGFGDDLEESEYNGEGRYRDDMRAYLDGRGIGWVCWVFSANWTPRLIKEWDSFKPTESGEFFRAWMLHP